MVSNRWKWLTVFGNAVIGAAEIVTSNFSAMSVASDGVHNLGEVGPYLIQANNVIRQNETGNEARRDFLHKAGYWALSITSAATMVKAGVDWSFDHEPVANGAAVYTTGASVALNGLLLAGLLKGEKRTGAIKTTYERALSNHFKFDTLSALLALGGAILHKYNMVDVEQGLGVAGGLLGTYLFRPTKKNMFGGGCHGHGH